jgi:DNA-binding GntR family transcriptional regulator
MQDERHLDLGKVRAALSHRPRDLLLFDLLVESELTVPQVLSLKVSEMKKLGSGDPLPATLLNGPENQKPQTLSNQTAISLQSWLAHGKLDDTDYLFKSRKGKGPLSVTSVSRLVSGWLKEEGFENINGLRDLRKAPKLGPKSGQAQESSYQPDQPLSILPKIKEYSIQKTVYQELQNAIVSGRIAPGQRLVTDDIARQMGVSRSPVREAVGRLEARGFINTKPNWGSVVNELSRANLEEVLELRLNLECQAARKAVVRASEETIQGLIEAHEAYATARRGNDADMLLRHNREFHMLIYRDANSPVLLDIINQLWDRVSPYYHIMFRQSIRPQPTVGVNYHEHIVAAMGDKEVEQTCHWLRQDLSMSAKYVIDLFDAQSA